MKRYSLKTTYPCGEPWQDMEEDALGDYVLFEDAMEEIRWLQNLIDERTRAAEHWCAKYEKIVHYGETR